MALHKIAQRLERNAWLTSLRSDCTLRNQRKLADAGRLLVGYLVDEARASSQR